MITPASTTSRLAVRYWRASDHRGATRNLVRAATPFHRTARSGGAATVIVRALYVQIAKIPRVTWLKVSKTKVAKACGSIQLPLSRRACTSAGVGRELWAPGRVTAAAPAAAP